MKAAAIKFGPVSIHWFGVIVTLALIAGLLVAIGMARLRRERADPLAGILLLGLLAGMIGARAWFVAFSRDFYVPDPGRVFAVWEGGLALHGALLGAILATLIYTWSRELDFWTWADICAPGLVLGQGIGRIADLLNNQAFGAPTGSQWAVIIPAENRPPAYQNYSHFTPVAAYEGLWDGAIFLVLLLLTLVQRRWSRPLPTGTIFLAYLVLYSVVRIPLENLRLDSLYVGTLRVATVASYVLIVLGVLLYLLRLLPRSRPEPQLVYVPPQMQPSQAYYIAATRSAGRQPGTEASRTWEEYPAGGQYEPPNGYGMTTVELTPYQGATRPLSSHPTEPLPPPPAPAEEAS